MIFLLLVDARVNYTVQRDFLQVSDTQLPSKSGVGVVERHTSVVEEAGVVAANGELNTSVHQVTDWVGSQIKGVPKDHVAEGAHFNADVLVDELLNKVREEEKLESVTNALRVKQNGVVQVSDAFVVCLASVTESRHLVSCRVLIVLGGQNLGHKL